MSIDLETAVQLMGAFSLIASVIVSMTETPLDDRWWARIYPYLEKAALIFGKAKDK